MGKSWHYDIKRKGHFEKAATDVSVNSLLLRLGEHCETGGRKMVGTREGGQKPRKQGLLSTTGPIYI